MKLSILDQSPISKGKTPKDALEASIELAKLTDELGYHRYWVAEHHDLGGLASPAPDILLGIIGSQTEQIRIGSGAVLLPNYSPYHIAERYNELATLYPNRVDLGLGRAPGGSAEVSIALAGNFLEKVRMYPKLVDEVILFLHQDFPSDHMYAKVSATPVPKTPPVPWLLGTSNKSAKLAIEKRLPFVFGHFMSNEDGPSIVKEYMKNVLNGKSNVIVTVSAICAETTEEAEEIAMSNYLWKILQDKGEGKEGVPSIEEAKAYPYSLEEKERIERMKQNQIVGNPSQVREQLENLQSEYEVDELMIVTITHSYEARKKSYQLLAEEFCLA
ncbi:LLM class flavin-dependent oxidoreductase [Oceanobacillus caeni]|uniref:Luciferase n=1 Tax=Oceanobacillus caeni TaxID=405946 RepID=A0ABR5MND4_9BACI|nr:MULTISPECIES: LLM class flavin-dependent oxidoreductase [Bacillaceae]KPH78743.1 luciferase [Oceanobacillus caeni]MBU8790219.1 LLM class flavin-dependent oxidoreductase [Oceanobacillus caeni]MCR1833450.1 LLM class flavin-dependent oxidoreductase [Oceanobacillus caeni]